MRKDSKKDELVGRTLVFTLKNGKSFKYGTVIKTETTGNETKLFFDTDEQHRDNRVKGDFRSWIRSIETFPKLS